ncbi:uncharacterized protein MYCFIDRAFT_201533 [Pseudocercospora fijiensis CIRAD86]|uniref:NAD-dependent epimerase/dehydratase domain-containing protein n=1 Tax=Pseudocercospora fijiensis (strain CIRAD86) TaxID=383855 RepID=N1QBB9_PSEFD|nr:uncharacterized protein MYCFIDRAFT_201533 [Pseudocercospora fijiensis CIRAD86]EME88413.1 hypothetical protein MYCFIDRAFT_201533 [Pseudocercospora fijiensis CIRAD86]
MASQWPPIPPNSLVLVTGANGWLGSHVTDQLLALGYRVRGTVRDENKSTWTTELFRKKYGPHRYHATIVEDMAPKGAFDTAVQGCSGIVHCASVTNGSPDPTVVIIPTIAGALNILESARREPSVKRFIYTSATAAAVNSGPGVRGDVNSDSWNMSSFFSAWKHPPYTQERAWEVYASSKLQTEQAVWRWYSETRPDFVVNTVLPSTLWGKMLVCPQCQGYPTSIGWLKQIWEGNAADVAAWVPPQYCIDVQDAALLHVAALTLPDVMDQRIFAAYTPWNVNTLLDLLRMLYPKKKIEKGDLGDHGIDMTFFREMGVAERLLKRMGKEEGFRDLESSLARCISSWS